MEPIVLTDPSFTPTNESLFERFGEKQTLWLMFSDYLYQHYTDISEV